MQDHRHLQVADVTNICCVEDRWFGTGVGSRAFVCANFSNGPSTSDIADQSGEEQRTRLCEEGYVTTMALAGSNPALAAASTSYVCSIGDAISVGDLPAPIKVGLDEIKVPHSGVMGLTALTARHPRHLYRLMDGDWQTNTECCTDRPSDYAHARRDVFHNSTSVHIMHYRFFPGSPWPHARRNDVVLQSFSCVCFNAVCSVWLDCRTCGNDRVEDIIPMLEAEFGATSGESVHYRPPVPLLAFCASGLFMPKCEKPHFALRRPGHALFPFSHSCPSSSVLVPPRNGLQQQHSNNRQRFSGNGYTDAGTTRGDSHTLHCTLTEQDLSQGGEEYFYGSGEAESEALLTLTASGNDSGAIKHVRVIRLEYEMKDERRDEAGNPGPQQSDVVGADMDQEQEELEKGSDSSEGEDSEGPPIMIDSSDDDEPPFYKPEDYSDSSDDEDGVQNFWSHTGQDAYHDGYQKARGCLDQDEISDDDDKDSFMDYDVDEVENKVLDDLMCGSQEDTAGDAIAPPQASETCAGLSNASQVASNAEGAEQNGGDTDDVTQEEEDQIDLEASSEHPTMPRLESANGYTQLDFINPTSLMAHAQAIGSAKSDYTFMTEHAVPKFKKKAVKRRWFKAFGSQIHIGPLSGEAKGRSAGIAATCGNDAKLVNLNPSTKNMQEVVQAGRAAIYVADLGGGGTCIVYCLYGWTGSAVCKRTGARTDDILSAMLEESKSRRVPCAELICGDLSCVPKDLLTGNKMVSELGWTDLGAEADRWGKCKDQPTCKANKDSTPTRRDVMMTNSLATELVVDFCVRVDPEFKTHSKLSVVLKKGSSEDYALRNAPGINFVDRFEEVLKCETQGKDCKEAAQIRNARREFIHQKIDEALKAVQHKLEDALRRKDTTSMWQEWSNATVKALIEALNITGPLKIKANNHGRPHVKKFKTGHIINKRGFSVPKEPSFINNAYRRANRQANRLQQLIHRLGKHGGTATEGSKQENQTHIEATIRAIMNTSANHDDELDKDLFHWTSTCTRWDTSAVPTAFNFINALRKIATCRKRIRTRLITSSCTTALLITRQSMPFLNEF